MSPHSDDSTGRYYDERADEYIARTEHLDMAALYEPFLALLPNGGAILDAGCGPGRDAQAFATLGYRVTAFDASARMVELTQQRAGIAAVQMRFQELTYDREFDGIWACASLLHVPLDDLSDVLKRLRRALKIGGVFFMSFKHGSGERIEEGRQFLDFIEGTLCERLGGIAGMSIIRIWSTDDQSGRANVRWVNALVRRES
jgi:2-polyprenyl-3-methyl-5-hydroxy-6-metoxy-1,4-benzoquinol methylase